MTLSVSRTPSGPEAAAAAAGAEAVVVGVAEAAVADGEDGEVEVVDEAVTGIETAVAVVTRLRPLRSRAKPWGRRQLKGRHAAKFCLCDATDV